MQIPPAGGPSDRRAPGPFVGGRSMTPAQPAASHRPRPFAPAAGRLPSAVPQPVQPAPLVMQAPVGAEPSVDTAEDTITATEPAMSVPPGAPVQEPDAAHWAIATYDRSMSVDESNDEPAPAPVMGRLESQPAGEPERERPAREAEYAAATLLESVAGRLRRGEILLAAGTSRSDSEAAVVAAVLSALLGAHR